MQSDALASATDSRRWPWPRARSLALFALLMLTLWADPLFLGRNFAGRDILGYHMPVEKAIHDAYARGRLPEWMADVSGGRPLLANPNAGSFYPVRPLLAVLPFPLALRIYPVLHWLLAGFGMLLLGESLGLTPAGAWMAAATYALSGVSVSEVFYTNIQPGMTLLPWVLWALHRPASPAGRAVSLAAAFGLLFLSGDVFICCLALLCSVVWIVVEEPSDGQKAKLAAVGIGLSLAALLAAPQIIATALWIPMTNRGVLGMRMSEALYYSVSPLRLLEFVIPYPFGETWELNPPVWGVAIFREKTVGFFTTFYTGAFAAIALWAVRRQKAPGARFGWILFLFSAALSVLPRFFPASLGNLHSPLPLRYPEKMAVGMVLAAALAAGIVFDAFRRDRRIPRWPLAVAAALALTALALRFFPSALGRLALASIGGDRQTALRAGQELTRAFAEGGLLWIATVVGLHMVLRESRVFFRCGLALLTLVPAAATLRIARTFPVERVLSPTAFDHFLRKADPDGSFRTMGTSSVRVSKLELDHLEADPWYFEQSLRDWNQYSHSLQGRGTILQLDYDHGDLSRTESLRMMSYSAANFLDSGPFFGAISLRWAIRYQDQISLGEYRPIRTVGLQVWDEHARAFPDIRLLEQWKETPSSLGAAGVLPKLTDGEVVLETDAARAGTARPGRLRVIEKTPERVVVLTQTQDPTWLFVLRGFWPHRSVRVDGQEVEQVPAQIAFTAVPIPPGSHRLEWEETLPGGDVSRFGPVLGLLGAAGLLARQRRLGER